MVKLLHGQTKIVSLVTVKALIYILIYKTCDTFYLGQTQNFKQRTAKHILDVKKHA